MLRVDPGPWATSLDVPAPAILKAAVRRAAPVARNRLGGATSPYLLQHADNPVAWWPWCDEAFAEARRRDVPVFLSIGYATCHWCHVMAHECFEDKEVAAALNDAFVCIKVDREERPDVDEAYMQACLAQNGSGGWPLTALLDHARHPWFTGTYFPKRSRPGRIGLLELTERIQEAWRTRREEIEASAAHLAEHLRRPPPTPGDVPGPDVLDRACEALLAREAPGGGFGGAPRFPGLQNVRFLLRMHRRGRPGALGAATRQLDAMARGGIHDHVAGGFHRYSTDPHWHLPHFEKMLYDQAMALVAYGEAHAVTGSPLYEDVIRGTVGYLVREMRHESGAFFAAQDADSEGEEGRFATWPWEELVEVLHGDEDLARALGARPEGNFHDEATGRPVPRNILFHADPEALDGPLRAPWDAARPRLLARRQRRPQPLRDDKVLADWNMMLAAGLFVAGRALDDPEITPLAEGAVEGVRTLLAPPGDGWRFEETSHAWCAGRRGRKTFFDDLAALAFGFAHQGLATHRPTGPSAAASVPVQRFGSAPGVHRRAASADLPATLGAHDGATPSATALYAEALLLAARSLGRPEEASETVLRAHAEAVRQQPLGHMGLLTVAADLHAPYVNVIVATGNATRPDDAALAPFRQVLAARPHPCLYALVDDGSGRIQDDRPELAPWLAHDRQQPAAVVCRGDACGPPCRTPEELAAAIDAVLPDARSRRRP